MGQPQNIVLETGQLDRLNVLQCQLTSIVVFLTVIIDGIGILYYHFIFFLKNKKQKHRWILAIKWDEGPAFKVMNSTVVCSAHFLPSDYAVGQCQHRRTSGLYSIKKKHKWLNKDAIPSSFAFLLCKSLDVP